MDVCSVEVGERGPWVGVSITLLWKGASEVGKVGDYHVGGLCLVDGVEGLQQLLIALGVRGYVC